MFFLLENKNNEVHDLTMNILSITDANAPVEIVKCANQEEINEMANGLVDLILSKI